MFLGHYLELFVGSATPNSPHVISIRDEVALSETLPLHGFTFVQQLITSAIVDNRAEHSSWSLITNKSDCPHAAVVVNDERCHLLFINEIIGHQLQKLWVVIAEEICRQKPETQCFAHGCRPRIVDNLAPVDVVINDNHLLLFPDDTVLYVILLHQDSAFTPAHRHQRNCRQSKGTSRAEHHRLKVQPCTSCRLVQRRGLPCQSPSIENCDVLLLGCVAHSFTKQLNHGDVHLAIGMDDEPVVPSNENRLQPVKLALLSTDCKSLYDSINKELSVPLSKEQRLVLVLDPAKSHKSKMDWI